MCMKNAEVMRFLRTMDALQPRRDVYKWDDDYNTKCIDCIRKAIGNGINKKTDIVAFVEMECGLSLPITNSVLKHYQDVYWDFTHGRGKTRYYFLINEVVE